MRTRSLQDDAPGQAPSPPAAEPGPSPEPRGIPAQRVILGLFVVLAACTAVALLWFMGVARERMLADIAAAPDAATRALLEERMRQSLVRVHTALAGDLAAPVVVWFLLKGVASQGRVRLYWILGSIPAALATMALVLLLLDATGAAGL